MLELSHLSISFKRYSKGFRRQSFAPVVDASLSVKEGEIVALIGASGAGKSLLAHSLLGLLPKNATITGKYTFKGNILSPQEIKQLRGREIALIPQSINYLNPLTKIRKQVYRSARLSGRCCCTADQNCDQAFSRYQLGDKVKSYFPFQISGGMARRVLTATATVGKAELIIADEPTTGLDPELADQSLTHLQELAAQGKGVLLITHDLENASKIADTIVVMYEGFTMEIFPKQSLYTNPAALHPYTNSLWNALPQNEFTILPAASTSAPSNEGNRCAFAGRCPMVTSTCLETAPTLIPVNDKMVRCFHATS